MKKLVMLTFAAVFSVVVAGAQKLAPSAVPAPVKNSFAKDHPGQTAKWEKENADYEASFMENSISISVLYNATGDMTETETDIKISELPSAVLDYVKKNQPRKSVREASEIMTAAGVLTYEAHVAGQDLIFDKDGNFIKGSKE